MKIYKPTLKPVIFWWLVAIPMGLVPIVGLVFIAFALYETFAMLFYRASHKLIITNDEVIWEVGLFSKDTTRLKITDIRTIKVKQGFGGRLLNYGDVYIATAGTGTYEIKAHDMNRPREIERLLRG